jgi:DNA-binding NarL/FixJ family response regulator
VGAADPDVVLLDARLIGVTWLDATARLARNSSRARIILVAVAADDKLMHAASAAGVRGIILKSSSPMEIRRAVRAVAAGKTFFEPLAAAAASAGKPFGLTPQQLRVLGLIARGLSNKDVGRELHVSAHTVKTHVTQILRKLRARDRAHAAVIALREGIV